MQGTTTSECHSSSHVYVPENLRFGDQRNHLVFDAGNAQDTDTCKSWHKVGDIELVQKFEGASVRMTKPLLR